jgi:predicted HTH domain antitoxin
MNIELQIPDEVARVLSSEYADLPRAAVEALALEGYRSNRLSDGQLRQMLGFSSRMQVHAFLKERGIPLNYSLADLEHDRETSKDLEAKASAGNPRVA